MPQQGKHTGIVQEDDVSWQAPLAGPGPQALSPTHLCSLGALALRLLPRLLCGLALVPGLALQHAPDALRLRMHSQAMLDDSPVFDTSYLALYASRAGA